ncbi:MAG: L,D-transpeptidase [Synechococcus sp. BS301-5m-G53]|nr:L,D-transpeptidase [Synechococcus sp. BS301-5m-G53]
MLRATLLAVLAGACLQLGPVEARSADPIPPVAPWLSDAEALALLPAAIRSRSTKQLVLHRSSRQLILLEQGQLRLRVPAAVGTQGWETPLGEHRVLFKAVDPVWRHPGTGALVPPGGRNPLGSRWIAFYQDCSNPGGWDGEKVVQVRGCSHVGLHGTPHRWTVGRAVSHGCVRLYDEHIRRVFDLVDVGTPVVVLP